MKEDRAIREKAKNPSTSRGIYAQRGKRSNHDVGLDMVEKAREVEKKDGTNAIG